ncbi:MAG TPA: response regulator, partial [Tepidisphaeraceae bacterium]|nr:response regulator [Tepidisphaeraceae bacterium]
MNRSNRKILLLDGEDELIRQISRVFGGIFVTLHVRNPGRAIGLVETDPNVSAVITEQVMRCGDGVQLLESIRTLKPAIRRVMITSYSDLSRIVEGLHSGAIQSLLQRPATDAELLVAVCPEAAQR